MPAPRKFDEETRARAVRLYQDRLRDHGESKLGARRHVGQLLGRWRTGVRAVGFQNAVRLPDQRFQAAASYSLRRPPRIGRRRILP